VAVEDLTASSWMRRTFEQKSRNSRGLDNLLLLDSKGEFQRPRQDNAILPSFSSATRKLSFYADKGARALLARRSLATLAES
jgi:hypothetical protein